MSKLTREVKYLQESDRPKKAEPLNFTDWGCEFHNTSPIRIGESSLLDERANQYATYLQEFNAEEMPVEFEKLLDSVGEIDIALDKPIYYDSIFYLGECFHGSCFATYKEDKFIRMYFGKLNSGKF